MREPDPRRTGAASRGGWRPHRRQRRRDRESGRRYSESPEVVRPTFGYTGDGGFPEAPEFLDMLGSLFEDLATELPES